MSTESRKSLKDAPQEIEWGYNCLTQGIHHGRPEAIWNMTLVQTATMFSPVQLQILVTERIYQDAMQYVEFGVEPRFPKEWAERVKEIAAGKVLPVYQQKLGEITKHYQSVQGRMDLDRAIERFVDGKLNPNYNPYHLHDTINLLCRIVGTSASRVAAEEFGR